VYRQLIAILLLLSISYQSFVKLGIVIWYQINKEYVARNLCENRYQPQKNCCGKCYLNKQLKKTENNTSGNSLIPEKWNMGEVVAYTLPNLLGISITFYKFIGSMFYASYNSFITEGLHIPVFHPPSAC